MVTRYRYGEPNPVVAAVDEATVVEISDAVYLSSGEVLPASTAALWDTDTATTQEALHDAFLGIAAQRSRDSDEADLRINTSGRYEFDCDAATFELGDLVGLAKATGDNLESQKVVAVATENLAIGRIAKQYSSNTTRVLVEVMSTLMTGGAQAPA